jgi:tellurite resistance protein TerC
MLESKPLWMWAVFFSIIFAMLVIDLTFVNKKDHEIGVKESLKLSAVYIMVGVLYGFWVKFSLGAQSAELYWTGFLVEKSLSLDNIFVISLVFTYFGIPRKYQHRVLFWGILGALVMRGTMIGLGAEVISRYNWILTLFAAFLVFTGVKLLFVSDEEENDIGSNPVVKFFKKNFRTTDALHGNKFMVSLPESENSPKMKRFFTPLLLTLLVVECVDVLFAVDSVPAIFAITTDPYIVFTSNIFAILGLRTLYFALAAIVHRFEYLKYSIAAVLIFIGAKVLAKFILDFEVSSIWSLIITIGLLAVGVGYSLYATRLPVTAEEKPPETPSGAK